MGEPAKNLIISRPASPVPRESLHQPGRFREIEVAPKMLAPVPESCDAPISEI